MKRILFVVMIEEIYDRKMYNIYVKQVMEIIQSHNGEYIARSDKILPITGKKPERAIVIAFNSMEKAKKCFFSKEYERIKHLRENNTKSRAFFIDNNIQAVF